MATGAERLKKDSGKTTATTENTTPPAAETTAQSEAGNIEGIGTKRRKRRTKAEIAAARETESIAFQETEKVVTKRGRRKKKISQDEAREQAAKLLTMVESFATGILGDEAKYSDVERMILETSTPELLANVPADSVGRFVGILWPVMFAAGLGMYGLRLASIVNQKAEENRQKAEQAIQEQLQVTEDKTWEQLAEETIPETLNNPFDRE